MKAQNIMGEVEQSIEDKQERSKVLEGLLGYILTSTQVLNLLITYQLYLFLMSIHFFIVYVHNPFIEGKKKKKNNAGGSCGATICCTGHKTKSWLLGIC